MTLGFLLVREALLPNAEGLVAAATAVGLPLKATTTDSGAQGYTLPSGAVALVSLMPAPHPDVPTMWWGPTSPDRETAAKAPAHYIVMLTGRAEGDRENDVELARFLCALTTAAPVVGMMMGHGLTFHTPEFFLAAVKSNRDLPTLVLVDITWAREAAGRASVVTHGMSRYGKEEFYITAPQAEINAAREYAYMLCSWMLTEEYELPTGDTLGRTSDEKLEIQRVPHPSGEGDEVIRLDLP